MKTFATFMKLAIAGAVLLATPMFAQTSAHVRVEVPFTFQVGQQTLPAGEYTLTADARSGLMVLRELDTGHSTLTLTYKGVRIGGPDEPVVMFRVYGKNRFLAGLWVPGTAGLALAKSHAELEFARDYRSSDVAILRVHVR
jgi:hypothetical protein